jgi:hypothetical protein
MEHVFAVRTSTNINIKGKKNRAPTTMAVHPSEFRRIKIKNCVKKETNLINLCSNQKLNN